MLNQLHDVECPNITYRDDDFPIILKKGSGMHLWDNLGKRYLDFTSCFGVAALGHRSKVTLNTIRKQAAKLIHGMGDVHPSEPKIRFLRCLADMLPYQRSNTILSSTGSEAIETALKTAVLATGRQQFISFTGGYHGLTCGSLRLNNRPLFLHGFEQWLHDRAIVLPFPRSQDDMSLLEDALKAKKIAAIVLEPVQGRGGDRVFPVQYIQAASSLAKKYGTLLVFDEIFTGFGRTGTMFGFEHFGVVPDIICLGKAMGGGLPLSACAGDILEVWGVSSGEARHTSTFLGHPLSCAVGLATIKEIRRRLPELSAESRKIDKALSGFHEKTARSNLLRAHPSEITGLGFMRGIRFANKTPGFVFELTKKLLKQGFIMLPCGEESDVLSLTPPLIARTRDFESLFLAIDKVLSD